ncbi:MAG: ribosome recycling factor [Candidatus Ancillula sp.]|jgi:ribosome recycling factor|nr:ribosome recycling factor [Candidatus Ancillula sp.]
MVDDELKKANAEFGKVIEHLKEEFSTIRTGRVNAGLFSGVMVNYYGAPTPLQQLASITVAESRVAIVTPFDKGAIDAAVKGLQESDLGVNPSREGDIIRVIMPELTQERRKEYVKLAKTRAEEAKVSLRSVRHKAIDAIDKLIKDKEIGEDDGKRGKETIDKDIKKFSEQIDTGLGKKEAEILEV